MQGKGPSYVCRGLSIVVKETTGLSFRNAERADKSSGPSGHKERYCVRSKYFCSIYFLKKTRQLLDRGDETSDW